jgi:hypothetical protein
VSQEVYGLLRDFQPLIAALVALGAAIIAYVSAQRMASRQAAAAQANLEPRRTLSASLSAQPRRKKLTERTLSASLSARQRRRG